MEVPALATPGRRGREQLGNSPNAKRPASLNSLVNQGQATRPMMSPGDLNAFIYRVHYEVEAMKHCGFSVNKAMDDHAVRLDHVNIKKVREEVQDEMEKIRGEMEGIRAAVVLNQNDTLKAMKMIDDNDANIKTILNGITMEISSKMTGMESNAEDMQLRFDELKRNVFSLQELVPPGLGAGAGAGAKG